MKVLRPEPVEDPHAYWKLIADAWAVGEPFVIIEADVTEASGTIERFKSCPGPWCFNSYPVPKNAHVYEPVDAACRHESFGTPADQVMPELGTGEDNGVIEASVICRRLEHDHPSAGPRALDHPFEAVDPSCFHCGKPEHAPVIAVQIADLGGAALGCSRFRPADLPAIFEHEMLSGPTHWANLDVHITTVLREAGVHPHRHMPNAEH